jgi:CheY-like chemotaxis protein
VPEGHGELILLADDEPDVRRSVAEVIGRLGYRVLVAGDGEQAWALFRAHRADIALAILDVVMPGLSGVEAAARMRELNPGLPIILATGYDAGDELAHAEVSRVLSKPFRVDVLARAMRKALEES